jgi:hypothetical protein
MGKYVLFPDGKGEPRTLTPANPAAGANLSVPVPAGGPGVGPVEIWRPLMIQFELVTSVAVANRYLRFYVGNVRRINSSAVVASKNNRVQCIFPEAPTVAGGAIAGWNYYDFMLPETYIQNAAAGGSIRTDIIALDVADQISNVIIDLLVYRDRTV